MASRFNKRLTLTLFCIGLGCSVTAFVTRAYRQTVPIVVLQASERAFEDVPAITGITWSAKDNLLYAVSSTNPGLYAYESESKTAKQVGALTLNGGSVAAAPSGDVFVSAGESGVLTLSQAKPAARRVAGRSWHSLDVLTDNSFVVSPSDDKSLFSIFKSPGGPVQRIGQKKTFLVKGKAQNEFFNQGIVAVNQMDNTIYYVFTHALAPTVQHFTKQGELISEFQVEGAAIDLQSGLTKQILATKEDENCAGGYTVITSAAVDASTGHLWLGMNGSTKQGTVYEYSPEGVKLKEYAFLIKQPSDLGDIITGINGLAVRAPFIYLLTSDGAVYKFNLNNDVAASLRARRDDAPAKPEQTSAFTQTVKYVRSFWTPPPSALASLQLPCPQEQPLTCAVNCKPNTSPAVRDCGALAKSALPVGDIVIGQTACNNTGTGAFGQPTCVVSYNVCRSTVNGDRYSTTYTSLCNPPECVAPKENNPTTGACQCPADRPVCPQGQIYSTSTCGCVPSSPIVIDVSGNGFQLTDANGGVHFDLDADGVAEQLSWTAASSDDGWLALDRNGNGSIDNGQELFGNLTPQPVTGAPNGFLALAEFDKPANGGNNDGLISDQDAIFNSLRLWQDTNHNGVSEGGELHGLAQLGLKSIELDYKLSKRTDQYGNQFRYRAKVKDAQDTQLNRWAWDVFLVNAQ